MSDWKTELDAFVKHHEGKGSTPEYIRSATRYLKRLGERFDPQSFLDLTAKDIETWFDELRQDGLADISLGSIFSHVRACMRRLNDGVTPKSLSIFKVQVKKQWKKTPRVKSKSELLTDEEIELLSTYLTFRWKTALYALRYSGARPTEVLRLKESDVSIERHNGMEYMELAFPKTKTRVARTVPVARKEAIDLMRDYIKSERPQDHPLNKQGYLFFSEKRKSHVRHMTLWKALQRAKNKAGIKKRVYSYLARHTRATEVHDLPPAIRDKAMGWESGLMWKNYTHLVTDDVRDALLAKEGTEAESMTTQDFEDRVTEKARQIAQQTIAQELEKAKEEWRASVGDMIKEMFAVQTSEEDIEKALETAPFCKVCNEEVYEDMDGTWLHVVGQDHAAEKVEQ